MSRQRTKTLFCSAVKAAGTPDATQLAAIRVHTLRDFAPEELVVREFVLAHNGIDRDSECFGPDILHDFARTLPGKGVFIRHPGGWSGDGGPGEGKVYSASIERMSHDAARALLREPDLQWPPDQPDAVLLRANAYYVRTPDNESFLLKLDAGIAGEVSIAFMADDLNRVDGSDGIELNLWRWKSPGAALEMSHVWLGAQPGARAVKNANRNPEDTTMNDQEAAALRNENAQLKAAADAAKKDQAIIAGLRKALGENSALLENPEGVAEHVSAGIEYRKSLVQDIITAERHAGITGDSDQEVKAAADLYSSLPTPKLKALADRYIAARTKGAQLPGGDPNATKPNAGQQKAAEGTPAANPMFVA